MNARVLFAGLLAALALWAASCDWPVITDYDTEVAYVYEVVAPDTVEAGLSFLVSIRTTAEDPRWEFAGDEVRSGTGGVLIVPRNRVGLRGNVTFATIEGDVTHNVVLRLQEPGRTRLYVRTRTAPHTLGTIERDLYVR